MPTREEFIQSVDAFFAGQKVLVGVEDPVQWQPNRDPTEQVVRIPIEMDGVQYGQSLTIVSRPASETPEFSLNIIYGVGICRLDYDETGGHTNGFLAHLDNLPMIVSGRHFHRWAHNKRFVEGDLKLPNLKHAEDIPAAIHSFDSCLRWFCDETGIFLPHNHQIFLPPRVLI